MKRIFLSVPHMCGVEQEFIASAFEANWISTVGPNIVSFETEFQRNLGIPAVAVSSGTAAIHLGLRSLGVEKGDLVLCSTLTFVASANPIRYLGAEPAFVDSDYETWNMDPDILEEALRHSDRVSRRPKAVVVVDLYGQCANFSDIRSVCDKFGVPILEDAAEALGATYLGQPAGTLGDVGCFSFNGNKIITTSGGGMVVCDDRERLEKVRFWSQQARDPGLAYEHSEEGYNYRMSNVLAGIGCGQMNVLEERVRQRRAIAERYRASFADVIGLYRMPEADYGLHTRWLSCFLVDERELGCGRDDLIRALEAVQVESRPVWKPMHLQPLFKGCTCFGGAVAEDLFRRGICLPSSSSLSPDDQLHVVNTIRKRVAAEELTALKTGHSQRTGDPLHIS